MIKNIQEKLVHIIMTREMYSEPCQTSKMELFAKIVNDFITFNYFCKNLFLSKMFVWSLNTPLMTASLALSSKKHTYQYFIDFVS